MREEITKCYILNVKKLENKETFIETYNNLPDVGLWKERKELICKLYFEEDKRRSLGAGKLLLDVLRLNGIKKAQLTKNEFGKLYLFEDNSLYFNLSHSGEYVVCSIGTSESGIDIEKNNSFDKDIAKRFFIDNEYKAITEHFEYCDDMFNRIWTLKESYIKAMGKGLSIPLNSFEIIPGTISSDNKIGLNAMMMTETDIIQDLYEGILYFKEFKIENYHISVCSKVPIYNVLTMI